MKLAAYRRVVEPVHTVLYDFLAREENQNGTVFIIIENTVYSVINLCENLVAAGICCCGRAAWNRVVNKSNREGYCIYGNNRSVIKIFAENFCVHCGRTYDNAEVTAFFKYTFYKPEYKVNV